MVRLFAKGGKIMFCKKCGTQLEQDAEFCIVCGTKVGNAVIRRSDEQTEGDAPATSSVNNMNASARAAALGSNIGYWLAFGAFGVMAFAFFLPIITAKAFGYSLHKLSLFNVFVQHAQGAMILVPIGLVIVFILILLKKRWARITAAIISMFCIGYPIIVVSEVASIEIGGILYLLAGIVLIVACFIPIETKDKPKKNWNHY